MPQWILSCKLPINSAEKKIAIEKSCFNCFSSITGDQSSYGHYKESSKSLRIHSFPKIGPEIGRGLLILF